MRYKFGRTIVISLGGSIIYPDQIDIHFLKKFNSFVRRFIKKGYKLVIVTGGGKPARVLQKAASKVSRATDLERDSLGVYATLLSGRLVQLIFKDVVDPVIWRDSKVIRQPKHPVTVASGWLPGGHSSDFVAVSIAKKLKVKEFVNAGKPAYVYEKDPKKFPKAKKFEKLSWAEYRKLIPKKWIPGFSSPVDPIAAKLCQKEKMAAIIINGKNLKNFENLLSGKNFQGTIIA